MSQQERSLPVTVIDPVRGWGFPDLSEVYEYRDLLYFLVWRAIKVAYAQSVGGFAWAIIQPAMQIFAFSIVFGGLLQLDTDGIPYPLFSAVAVIPWSYMAAAMSTGSNSLVANAGMLGKVYFPRLIYLLLPSIASLLGFFISLVLIATVLIYYQHPLTSKIILLPVVWFKRFTCAKFLWEFSRYLQMCDRFVISFIFDCFDTKLNMALYI